MGGQRSLKIKSAGLSSSRRRIFSQAAADFLLEESFPLPLALFPPSTFSNDRIGTRNRHVGLRNEHVGLRNEYVGLRNSHVGLRNEHVGLRNEHVGLRNEHVGLRNEHVGLCNEHVGLRIDRVGLFSAFFLLKSNKHPPKS